MSGMSLIELFTGDNWHHLHDVIVLVFDISPTRKQCVDIFKMLPENTQSLAYANSLADTEFKDNAYSSLEYMRDKIKDELLILE